CVKEDTSYHRTVRLDVSRRHSAVHVIGTVLKADLNRSAPPKSKLFQIQCSPTVHFSISPAPAEGSGRMSLGPNTLLFISMEEVSLVEGDRKVSLDVDADRDGKVEQNNPDKGSWTWGPEGHGAVVLVNCDSDHRYRQEIDSERKNISTVSELKDMSLMVLRTRGPTKLPDGYKLTLHMCQGDAERVRVFRENTGDRASNFLCEYRTD
ncbi:hypothetical protein CRUP_005079, partial [Coryphaenoides rupestris]